MFPRPPVVAQAVTWPKLTCGSRDTPENVATAPFPRCPELALSYDTVRNVPTAPPTGTKLIASCSHGPELSRKSCGLQEFHSFILAHDLHWQDFQCPNSQRETESRLVQDMMFFVVNVHSCPRSAGVKPSPHSSPMFSWLDHITSQVGMKTRGVVAKDLIHLRFQRGIFVEGTDMH